MTEFIGARISLVSKSDIRYVGTLHEISSEKATVALEQVTSFGTEGRRSNPEEEIPASDSVYEYIVFRGSDVKDLRIEEPAKPKENKPPQVPNDPAILGSGSRPSPAQPPQGPPQQQPQYPPQFQQQAPYPPYYYPPPGQRFGPQGGPPGPGFQGGFPYGAPPGWYPPPPGPGQGFPQMPGPYGTQQPPAGSRGPPGPPAAQQQTGPKPTPPAPIGSAKADQQNVDSQKPSPPKEAPVKAATETKKAAPIAPAQKNPTPPVEPKSTANITTAVTPPALVAPQAPATTKGAPSTAPTGPKSGRIMPAVPLSTSAPKNGTGASASTGPAQTTPGSTQPSQSVPNAALQNATQLATAAVAAAMAKLPPAPSQKSQQGSDAVDNLTKKVNEMRPNDNVRTSRQPGTGGYAAGNKGGRAGFRGNAGLRGNAHAQNRKVDVPAADFDFESANAKFNKQELVKEAIASGSPVNGSSEIPTSNGSASTSVDGAARESEKIVIPVATYNKSTSFFDNISSDTKDRDDTSGKRPGGREWRGEEQKKNLETFGQGSVDNGGYRGGFRGRGRGGRGFNGRGRGGFAPRGGRGGHRGGQSGQVDQSGVAPAST